MSCAQGHSGGCKPLSFLDPGSPVSAEIEISSHLSGDDIIASSKPSHAAGTDQRFFRKKLPTAVNQHSLILRPVKSFADNTCILKKPGNILFCDFFTAGLNIQPGIDLKKLLFQCFCLIHTQMGNKIVLPVQICHIHLIKVNKMKMSHSCSGQKHRHIRAQAPKACHRNLCLPQFFRFFPCVPGKKGFLQFFPGWDPFLHKISLLPQN